MNLQAMMTELADNLTLAGVDAPSYERMVSLLNRAKDEFVQRAERADEDLFTTRSDVLVGAGSTYFDLPSACRRIVGMTRSDADPNTEFQIIDIRDRWKYQPTNIPIPGYAGEMYTNAYAVYIESGRVYFISPTGAASAMTIRVRYRKRVDDLTFSNPASEWTDIPEEWHRTIIEMATALAIPYNNPEYGKYAGRVASQLQLMRESVNDRVNNEHPCIQWSD